MNILVVDDDSSYRMLMRSYLQANGWDVAVAENGEDALHKMSKQQIDMVVSDVFMPVMDGIKFHKAVRALSGYEQIPFLFISGYDDKFISDAVEDPKIDGFHRKASPMDELKEWIEARIPSGDDAREDGSKQKPRKSDRPRAGRDESRR